MSLGWGFSTTPIVEFQERILRKAGFPLHFVRLDGRTVQGHSGGSIMQAEKRASARVFNQRYRPGGVEVKNARLMATNPKSPNE